MFTCPEVVSLVICNDFSRQRRLVAGRGRGTTRQCLVGLNSRTRRGERLGSREGKPLSMNPVSSALLCSSVRNRTHSPCEKERLRLAGEFLLSRRIFLSLTELTDLTEHFCAQFRAHEEVAPPPTPPPQGYSLYTSLFNKKSFNKRVRYKQNLRDLITKNQ